MLKEYDYQYALVPAAVAAELGIGWRKSTPQGFILINQTEANALEGETMESKVVMAGGECISLNDAKMLLRQIAMSRKEATPGEAPEEPSLDVVVEAPKEILPVFPESGTQEEILTNNIENNE